MSVFENITKKVTKTARAAAKKSGEIVEVTKLKYYVGVEKDKISGVYCDIGRLVFESFNKGEEVSEAIRGYCETIAAYEENIKEMNEKILELQNIKICPACNEIIEEDAAYCKRCGTKQEIPQPVVEEIVEKACPSCETLNDVDSVFCSKCGSKLD